MVLGFYGWQQDHMVLGFYGWQQNHMVLGFYGWHQDHMVHMVSVVGSRTWVSVTGSKSTSCLVTVVGSRISCRWILKLDEGFISLNFCGRQQDLMFLNLCYGTRNLCCWICAIGSRPSSLVFSRIWFGSWQHHLFEIWFGSENRLLQPGLK
jgi:hypothetical protein